MPLGKWFRPSKKHASDVPPTMAAPETTFHFLLLPAKLRIRIYREISRDQEPTEFVPCWSSQPVISNISRANHQTRHEYLTVHFTSTDVVVKGFDSVLLSRENVDFQHQWIRDSLRPILARYMRRFCFEVPLCIMFPDQDWELTDCVIIRCVLDKDLNGVRTLTFVDFAEWTPENAAIEDEQLASLEAAATHLDTTFRPLGKKLAEGDLKGEEVKDAILLYIEDLKRAMTANRGERKQEEEEELYRRRRRILYRQW